VSKLDWIRGWLRGLGPAAATVTEPSAPRTATRAPTKSAAPRCRARTSSTIETWRRFPGGAVVAGAVVAGAVGAGAVVAGALVRVQWPVQWWPVRSWSVPPSARASWAASADRSRVAWAAGPTPWRRHSCQASPHRRRSTRPRRGAARGTQPTHDGG
jgi:hypothetical protein